MQCPNCRHEEDGSALKCSKCGFALANWRSRPQADWLAPLAQPPAAAKKASGGNLSIWILLLIATAGVWKLTRSGQDAASGGSLAAVSGAAEAGSLTPANSWRFEGKVVDLLRGGSIKGAKVAFLDWETGRQFEGITDEEGHYAVDVAIRWKLGYAAEISHPLYRQRYWSGADLKADRKERLRMGLEPAPTEPDARSYRGTRK